ncbi:MAG: hypothetical protein HC808_10910, partial [Candidatus Competibacteraceae bacterium]|nr:hypothetical protein [Candidatus Competibacteraceae bacterium]
GCGTLPAQDACISFGNPGDQPIAGDWDNDGFVEIGVRRNRSWYLDNGNGTWDGCGSPPAQDTCIDTFGNPGDQVLAGDWNGDGFTGIGVKRGRAWFLDRNADGLWYGCTSDQCIFGWGTVPDKPISGRWKP